MIVPEQKQMLYISVEDKEHPALKFEMEPYYKRSTRRIYTESALGTFDVGELLKDEPYIEDIGFSLILRLLLPESLKDSKGRAWAQIVYPHDRNGDPVLRIDEEPYEYKPHRVFCTTMPLPTMDVDEAIRGKALKIQLGQTVLQHLPLRHTET